MRTRAFRPVYESLREQIVSGKLHEGSRLPAEEQLAASFGVSRVTIREALSALDEEGLLLRHHGIGSFVSPHARAVSAGLETLAGFTETLRHRVQAVDSVLDIRPVALDDAVAATLDVPTGTAAYEIHSLRTVQDVPAIYCIDVLTAAVAGEEVLQRRRDHESLLAFLERDLDIQVRALPMTVEAVAAAGEVASALGLAAGSPVLYLHGPGFGDSAKPIYYSTNYFRTDAVPLTIVRRRR